MASLDIDATHASRTRSNSPASNTEWPSQSGTAPYESLDQYNKTAEVETSSEDESDVEIRRPAGRAARRMLGPKADVSPHGSQQQPEPSSAQHREHTASDSEDDLYSATPRKGLKPHTEAASSPVRGPRSPLFVSPAKSTQEESEDELPRNPFDGQSRLAELVAQKRAERLAREAEQRERASDHASSDLPDELVEDPDSAVNLDEERIMSDAVKPTRKASKRAMLEMERETQRIARQQALAHQMKVRKKFTTSSLFARFNFRPGGEANTAPANEGDTTASSAPNSDAAEGVAREPVSTPPSSPPTPLDRQRALVEQGALSKLVPVREDSLSSLREEYDDDAELPDIAQILSSSRKPQPSKDIETTAGPTPKKGLKLARLGKKAMAAPRDDSDDELEIVQDVPHRLSVFDKAKGTMKRQHADSTAIHNLKHLAYLGADHTTTSRGKKGNSRPSMTPAALETQLRLRAKEQARVQQLERIAELKAKGIEVLTSEEREREQEEFENLLEKARQEAAELREAEKAAAKDAKGTGDAAASDDESEDEDYVDVDGSGSEDEENEKSSHEMVDDAASESEEDEEEAEDLGDQELGSSDEREARLPTEPDLNAEPERLEEADTSTNLSQTPIARRQPRKTRVIVDEDDESDTELARLAPPEATQAAGDDDPFAAFGFGSVKSRSSLMSPTQAFNATMQTPTQATQQESMDVLRHLVPPSSISLPSIGLGLETQHGSDSQLSVIPGSQMSQSPQINLAWETQPPETPLQAAHGAGSQHTIETPGWLPTQDAGLPETPSQQQARASEMPLEDSTQSTVRIRISESPAAPQERKRLHRGQRAIMSSDDEDEASSASARRPQKDAFREMARKRKEALSAAELAEAEREAKQMMDEQAEESEDEYAGLGGDDLIAPETEQDREMIDSSHVDVNERELAAHFAERQRVEDEAEYQRLYKDLTTGRLRRKQANAFDLDEDEDDLAVRRRQMRQREEARKRKLLLQDSNIAGLAEGKQSRGKDAFLKAIADDDERDDDVLDLSDEQDTPTESQSEGQVSQRADSQAAPLREVSGNKRRLEEAPEDRLPAKQRRTNTSAFRTPKSLLEVRESLSFLLDEPNAAPEPPSVLGENSASENEDQHSEHEEEEDNDESAVQEELERQNDGGFAPDRIAMPPPRLPASHRRTPAKPAVVDRLSLKRGNSASELSNGRTAWSAGSNGGFKVPSLLRRATTNTAFNVNERGVSTSNGLSRENSGSGVKMGGTKKSSLAYQARDAERKAIVEASAKRRAENTARIAQLRRNASGGCGKGLGGSFE